MASSTERSISLSYRESDPPVLLLSGDRVADKIERSGYFEPDTLKAWAGYCRPRTTVLDIGAYNGLFSLIAAKVEARPVAFEPLAINARRIEENAVLNDVGVTVVEGAVSERDGWDNLGYNVRVPWTSGASLERKTPPHKRVRTYSIDGFGFDDVSAVKIDVERHEVPALRGALRTIERCLPVLIVETLTPAARVAVKDLLPGYQEVSFLDGRNLVMIPR